jgi:hypothetical protein
VLDLGLQRTGGCDLRSPYRDDPPAPNALTYYSCGFIRDDQDGKIPLLRHSDHIACTRSTWKGHNQIRTQICHGPVADVPCSAMKSTPVGGTSHFLDLTVNRPRTSQTISTGSCTVNYVTKMVAPVQLIEHVEESVTVLVISTSTDEDDECKPMAHAVTFFTSSAALISSSIRSVSSAF